MNWISRFWFKFIASIKYHSEHAAWIIYNGGKTPARKIHQMKLVAAGGFKEVDWNDINLPSTVSTLAPNSRDIYPK